MLNVIATSLHCILPLVVLLRLCSRLSTLHHVHYPSLNALISSPFLDHQLCADDTQLFVSFRPLNFDSSISHLHNALQRVSSWVSAILFHPSPKPVTITSVNFAVSGLTWTHQLPVPLLPLSFTPNLISIVLSTVIPLSLSYPVSSRSRTLLLVLLLKLLLKLKSCHISPIQCSLHWLRITEHIEYKLLSLTYKLPTITQTPYVHDLIFLQHICSTCFSFVVTLAQTPTSSSLKITDRSLCYASSGLWNQLPMSLHQPHSGTRSSISDSPISSLSTFSLFIHYSAHS